MMSKKARYIYLFLMDDCHPYNVLREMKTLVQTSPELHHTHVNIDTLTLLGVQHDKQTSHIYLHITPSKCPYIYAMLSSAVTQTCNVETEQVRFCLVLQELIQFYMCAPTLETERAQKCIAFSPCALLWFTIDPMSCLFNVRHELSHHLLQAKTFGKALQDIKDVELQCDVFLTDQTRTTAENNVERMIRDSKIMYMIHSHINAARLGRGMDKHPYIPFMSLESWLSHALKIKDTLGEDPELERFMLEETDSHPSIACRILNILSHARVDLSDSDTM